MSEAIIAQAVADYHEDHGTAPDPADEPSTGIESPEGEDATPAVEDGLSDPGAVVAGDPPVETPKPVDPFADDPIAKELGLKPRTDGRENRIPYSRVQKIAANAEAKARESVLAEVASTLGVDVKTLKPGALKEAFTDRLLGDEDRAERDGYRNIQRLMENDGDNFVRLLAQVDPARYGKFLTALEGGGGGGTTAPAQTAGDPNAAKAVPMPQPDLDLGDGRKTYSIEGAQKLAEWSAAEAQRKAEEIVTQRMNERFKPLEDERETERQRVAAEKVREAQTTRAAEILQEASQWDGFKDNADEILALLRQDSADAAKTGRKHTLTLEGAYRQVVFPKFKADKAKIREEVIAEAKKAVTGTSAGSQTPVVPAESPVARTGVDIIKQSLAAARKAGTLR